MNHKDLCIVPCGSAKTWDKQPNAGPTEAQDVYTGVFASTCQRYAETFFDNWVILSAKYGFLLPKDIITGPYNVSFNKPSNETIGVNELKEQAKRLELHRYNEITLLGGKHYINHTKAVFNQGQTINLPLSDCKGMGYMLQKLTNSIEAARLIEDGQDKPVLIKKPIVKSSIENGKYTPLLEFLKNREGDYLELSIEEIEDILDFSLPASAIKHRAWWANDITHSHAKSWLFADWEIDKVTLPNIAFRKMEIDANIT